MQVKIIKACDEKRIYSKYGGGGGKIMLYLP